MEIIKPVFRESGKGFFFVKHPQTDHEIILLSATRGKAFSSLSTPKRIMK